MLGTVKAKPCGWSSRAPARDGAEESLRASNKESKRSVRGGIGDEETGFQIEQRNERKKDAPAC